MGVQGLWHILHSTGRDIDLSSLEGKVLAIDLSIWLNQALKSGIDSPNAHLEILFRRICKLLFYKIKPVFVFDGPSPSLKKETILARRKLRKLKLEKSEQIKSTIINLLMKKKLVQKRKHSDEDNSSEVQDLFKLPENEYYDLILNNNFESEFGFSDIAHDFLCNFPSVNEINFESESFLSMPLEVQHEVIRNVAKEKRYGYDTNQNSFTDKSGEEFSSLQIQRLLSRHTLQQKVEDLRTTMNYRNNQSVIGSLNMKQLQNLPLENINTKKIMSRNEGYLMMIDPSETDIVDTLTKLKAEYLFKNRNMDDQSNTSILTEEIGTSMVPKNAVNCEKNRVINSSDYLKDMKNIQNYENTNNYPNKQNNIPDSDIDNKLSIYFESDLDRDESPLDLNNTCKSSSVTNNYNRDENGKSSEIESMFCNVSHEINIRKNDCELLSAGNSSNIFDYETESKSSDLVNVNIETTNISTSTDQSELNQDYLSTQRNYEVEIMSNNVDLEQNSKDNKSFNADLHENKESDDNDVDDDDFIDVPEIIHDDDKTKSDSGFSEAEIEMIINDPLQWDKNIEETIENLYKEEQKIECQAASMSERYYQEAKELLKLFGIPYVESPAEAEAQCAYLEKHNFTDGTITEDSDIWLFGANLVYKHVFSHDFSVRAYTNKQIHKVLGLSQDLMICIALLSGSDYTPGVYGIGPVISMEILAEFSDPEIDHSHFQVLKDFKSWHDKWVKFPEKYKGNPGRKRFLKFNLDSNFPDFRVIEAYNKPLVDESTEPFIWSKPSIEKLLEFAQSKIGWEKLKVIEMLNIINKGGSNSKFCQKSVLDYFTDSRVDELLDSKKSPSKRLRLATQQRNLIVENIKKFKK